MKIAFIIPKLVNQGPITVVKDIINYINNKVDIVDVYYFSSENEITIDCNCYKINFTQKINFDKYDIIHTHMLKPDLYIWFHKKHIKKAICISTLHQNIFQNLKSSYNLLIALIFEKIWIKALKAQDNIVTLTQNMQNHYEKKFIKKNIYTIYNGRNIDTKQPISFDVNEKQIINTFKTKYKVIGVSALLTKRKGIDQLIKALPYLSEYGIIIVGDGKEKNNLIKLAKKLNVYNSCLFLGYKIDGHRYIQLFDFYAMLSYSEGFPLGLLEAAQYKSPIICSDLPIFKEVFTEKEVSYFKLNDTKSLVDAIKNLQNNKQEFSSNVYRKVIDAYSSDKMGCNYLNLYNYLMLQN